MPKNHNPRSKVAILKNAASDLRLDTRIRMGFFENDETVDDAARLVAVVVHDERKLSSIIMHLNQMVSYATSGATKNLKSIKFALKGIMDISPGSFERDVSVEARMLSSIDDTLELVPHMADRAPALLCVVKAMAEMIKMSNDSSQPEFDQFVAKSNLKLLGVIK